MQYKIQTGLNLTWFLLVVLPHDQYDLSPNFPKYLLHKPTLSSIKLYTGSLFTYLFTFPF